MAKSKTTISFPSRTQVCNLRWTGSVEKMQNSFFSFLQKKKMTDCILSADGKFIYGHRVILASASLYFKKLFTSRPNDKDPVVHFHGISYMNLCLIMKYAYTGEVSMAEERVASFMEAAKSLEMIGLIEKNKNSEVSKKKKPEKKRSCPKSDNEDSDQNLSIPAIGSSVSSPEPRKRMRLNTLVPKPQIQNVAFPTNSESSGISRTLVITEASRKRRTSGHDDNHCITEPAQILKKTRSGDNPSYFFVQSPAASVTSHGSDVDLFSDNDDDDDGEGEQVNVFSADDDDDFF